ncbi:MAG: glycosyltransferase family 2 protein [Granulosicoccus sp.]
MKLSVIFSTYNSPRWLQKTLWGMLAQQHRNVEIVIADDGSTAETRQLIESMRPEFNSAGISLKHIWQSDKGFRKCRILNKAILHASNDYLVFTDGDCICRKDFLQVHAARAEAGYWLSGSYYKLPMAASERVTRDDIESGRCFERRWLRRQGLPVSASHLKLNRQPQLAKFLNRITPTSCNLKGSNASAWRADVIRVGGFDERMQWGGLDRELGVRLNNAGIRPRHVRYDAICVHLDHPRGYRKPELVAANRALRLNVEQAKITHTAHGISALIDEGYVAEQSP